MKLDSLTIRGFKSIRALESFELRDLNVLIGGNGAGKSNLLSFFRMLRALMDGALPQYVQHNGGMSGIVFNGCKVTPQMFFEMYFDVRGYRFALECGPSDACIFSREARYYKVGAHSWWSLSSTPDLSYGPYLKVEAQKNSLDGKNSKYVLDIIQSWTLYHFHDTSASASMRAYEIVQDNKSLRQDAANLAAYLRQLRVTDSGAYQDILNAVRLVVPSFDDFLLDEEEFGPARKVCLSWRQRGSDYPLQPYHFSDGSIRFICLATALLQPNPPSTIIIDEPELGLHPAAIAVLAELIKSAAKRTQVIIATQSPALIDYFGIEDIIVVNRKDGESTFERLKEEDFNAWLEEYSVGELWRKNVIAGGPVYE